MALYSYRDRAVVDPTACTIEGAWFRELQITSLCTSSNDVILFLKIDLKLLITIYAPLIFISVPRHEYNYTPLIFSSESYSLCTLSSDVILFLKIVIRCNLYNLHIIIIHLKTEFFPLHVREGYALLTCFSFLTVCNLTQHVMEPTYTHVKGNILDLVLSSDRVNVDGLNIFRSVFIHSDHFIGCH